MQQPPSTSTGGATDELRSDAQQLTSKAKARIHGEVDARKGAAVDQAQSVSSAIRQTADGLDDNAPQWLRSALRQGAEQIQRFADSVEQKDSRQLLNEVQGFARERPALFLGAAAAAGFAAARIFKAGGEQQANQSSSTFEGAQPWGDGEQAFDRRFESGDSSTGGQPFMARPETQSPTSDQARSADLGGPTGTLGEVASEASHDPLVLGTGGEAGRRISGQGDS